MGRNIGDFLELTGAWAEFFPNMLKFQATRTFNWVNEKLQELEAVWNQQPNTNTEKAQVLTNIWKLKDSALRSIRGEVHGLSLVDPEGPEDCSDVEVPGHGYTDGYSADCQRLKDTCNNNLYAALMRSQCAKTCGYC